LYNYVIHQLRQRHEQCRRKKKIVSYKLVLLGDASVGKSSSAERFVHGEFFAYHQPTIGASFLPKKMNVDDREIKYEIWDTAGQERFRSLAPMYYRGAAAAVVMYDITDMQTFNGAKSWVNELKLHGSADVVIAFVGNKTDREVDRSVPTDVAMKYASNEGCIFMECSAKNGDNVNAIFMAIGRKLPKTLRPDQDTNTPTVTLLKEAPIKDSRKPLCCGKS